MKRKSIWMMFIFLNIIMLPATQIGFVGEVFTETWWPYCPQARDGLQQLFENQPNVIPLIWEGDGQNQSPGNGTRKSLYGVGPIPHAQFQGYISDVGGGNTYPRYLGHYNGEINTNSPVEIELSLNFDNNGDLLVEANTSLTGNISTTNNKR